jgi:small subunit ribosomal protein S19
VSRSKWKGPFINTNHLTEIILLKNKNNYKQSLVISRNSEIIPLCVGLTFKVYNGKNYNEITIIDSMIGHKFGEFSFTRAKFIFKKKKGKKK